MAWLKALVLALSLCWLGFVADAAIVEHTFNVGDMTVRRLCQNTVITAVNGQMPGPTIEVNEGDTLVVHVINDSPYNMTIHWYGLQILSSWADGANMISQCPIRPGRKFTYKFNVTKQEGTLWWHAHTSFLRATVYGALIIRPRRGPAGYPFPKPDYEVPIIIGEWWNSSLVELERVAIDVGGIPTISQAFTINGQPGDQYNCSRKHMYELKVVPGKTYLLRLINSALVNQHFFMIAGHSFTVVATDASYTNPYKTDVLVLASGQTVDALMVADAAPGDYYMAALPYISTGFLFPGLRFDTSTTTAVLRYHTPRPARPLMPMLPSVYSLETANRFYTNITGLLRPGHPTVPLHVDEHMFVTFGFGLVPCLPSQIRCNRTTGSFAASMNNVSFHFPSQVSLLEASYRRIDGVYTADFPDEPPLWFDFTNVTDPGLSMTVKQTRVRKVRFGATVEMVLQNTAIIATENHPMHIHGYNFFILAQGFGNYNKATDPARYNLVNPQVRNTIGVPVGGWAVIRFVANNPGMWFMHCHLDSHLPLGLSMAFEVENGPDADSTLPPPPPDYPSCHDY
ncbi:laccase-7-like [Curcuma longa]|uniref:laccase-7-like n=1 Tax=Curcuma longa TaxID=136217 RepID=UPI003D9EB980